jgi:hypothetical protein
MQLAIICASAPAMKGFLTGLAQLATNRYGSRSGGSSNYRSDGYLQESRCSILIPNSSSCNAGKDASHTLTSVELSDKWDNGAATWYPNKSSHGMEPIQGKGSRVHDGGILITETFSINHGVDPYYKERRILGI